jgi:hypothetical protein
MKDKQWKDYWDVSLGVSYIPIEKLDPQVDMVALEDGGTFDDDTMPEWMKNMRGVAPNSMTQHQPGFIPVSSEAAMALQGGVDPAMAAAHGIALPGGPPPGMPPYGLPPGIPPPGGLLGHPPGGLLGAGLLPPPGAPNLHMPPRFGPPHGFPPSFDISQPPPGLRMAFPPPGMAGTNVPNIEGQGDVEMEIEDEEPQQQRSRVRGSRWGNNSESNSDDVASRLRNMADNNSRGEGGEAGGGPRSLLDLPPVEAGGGWTENGGERGKSQFHCLLRRP